MLLHVRRQLLEVRVGAGVGVWADGVLLCIQQWQGMVRGAALPPFSPPPARSPTPPHPPTLLQGDFAACMKLLQRYPPVDVALLTRSAEALKAGPKTVIVLD